MKPPGTRTAKLTRPLLSLCAFSLTEVVLALGIVAFGLVAIIGLIPVGLTSLKESVEDSSTEMIMENVRSSIVGRPLAIGTSFVLFYDADGACLGETPADPAKVGYRVEVSFATPFDPPPNTDLTVASVVAQRLLKGVGSQVLSTTKRGFLVTPNTGSGWRTLDPTYQPSVGL